MDYDSMVVNVNGSPFQFTFPSGGSVLECGASATTTWNVGGRSVAPNVGIDFSSNDGQNFSPLVGSTPNDGSHPVTVPQILTTLGRMKLVPSTDCFFAASQTFSITDTLAPSLVPPADIVQECASASGSMVALGSPTVGDQCDASSLVVNNNAPNPPVFPLGTTVVQWTATDGSGNQANANQMVTIEDTTPPSIGSVTATPSTLWPPNHKLRPVTVAVSVSGHLRCGPGLQDHLGEQQRAG